MILQEYVNISQCFYVKNFRLLERIVYQMAQEIEIPKIAKS